MNSGFLENGDVVQLFLGKHVGPRTTDVIHEDVVVFNAGPEGHFSAKL